MKLHQLIKRHLQYISNSKSIVIFVFLLLIANLAGTQIASALLNIAIRFTPQYLFDEIGYHLQQFVTRSWIYVVSLVPVLDFAIALLGLTCFRKISAQFVSDYSTRMKNNSSTLAKSIAWFYFQKALIHLGYILWIFVSYVFSYWLYKAFAVNSVWIFALMVAAVYPIFYFSQSVSAMLATLPLKNSERSARLKYLYCVTAMKVLYPFYSVRIGIEWFLSAILPVFLAEMEVFKPLIPLLVAIELCVPFSFLRTLSFEIKLSIFSRDEKICSMLSNGLPV
jgi:hypothetical protein